MAVGPELVVIRNESVSGKVDAISLGAFAPHTFPRLPADDPMHRFLRSSQVRDLAGPDSEEYFERRIADPEVVLWGIFDDQSLEGFTTLGVGEEGPELCYFGIVLRPEARSRGIGSLATSAMVSFALTDSALRSVSKGFSDYIAAVGTIIHPENHISQTMCERAGFVRVEGDSSLVDRVDFYSYLCDRIPKHSLATTIPG